MSRLTRRPPLMERDAYRLAVHGAPMDGSKAARELGVAYTPLEVGLPTALAWYWERGHLKSEPRFMASGQPA